jgi:hypothetical protein
LFLAFSLSIDSNIALSLLTKNLLFGPNMGGDPGQGFLKEIFYQAQNGFVKDKYL